MLVGVPLQFRPVLTTSPYYASSYVFVTRRSRKLNLNSFDDTRLRHMKVGVQVLEDDYTPAARALSRRRLTPNIVGFDVAGPEAGDIISAVARGKIDVAIVWGPLAGYFARKQGVALELTPVEPALDPPALPFRYAMAVGVRKADRELHDKLEAALTRRRSQIQHILQSYSVPEYQVTSQEARLR
jgi:ABC-type amino acid transport substrate-binding protein